MKLTSLNPTWVSSGGPGIYRKDPATGELVPTIERPGVGLMCDCPCGCDRTLYVPFRNPLDGGPPEEGYGAAWQRTGDTFETLSLTPSILRMDKDGCGWHGFVTQGMVRTV